MLLTRESILAAQDLKSQDVEVPEWSGTVRVRMMTGAERDALGASLIGPDRKPDMSQYRTRLLSLCIVGEDGKPLFGLDEIAALAMLVTSSLAGELPKPLNVWKLPTVVHCTGVAVPEPAVMVRPVVSTSTANVLVVLARITKDRPFSTAALVPVRRRGYPRGPP